MASIFNPILSPRLRSLLQNIDLDSYSRIPTSRLSTRALPNIHTIELVTGPSFAQTYDPLYTAMFPHRTERERSDLIVARLIAQDAGLRPGHAPYRLIGLLDPTGSAIGAAHISVLPLPNTSFAVPYLQYVYVRPQNRRQDLSEVLHTLVLGVAAADAATMRSGSTDDIGRTVPFTFFETEPPGHGSDDAARAFAHARALVHANSGGQALVLVPKAGDSANDVVTTTTTTTTSPQPQISAHVQPGLEPADPPLTLVWVVRPSPTLIQAYDIRAIGRDLVAAYYQSLRDEGFPEQNIRIAEKMVEERWRGRECVLVPLSGIKPIADWVG